MDDMVYNHGTISEKLEKESKQSHTAYEVGDFFVQALALADSRYVTLFDHNLVELQKETYPPTMTPTETIDDFCEKFDFVGVESLKNRTAPMLDSQNFYYNCLEVRDKDNLSKSIEQEYQNDGASQFAIYRLKDNDKNENLKEESLEILQSMGIELDKANYDCIYSNFLENLMSNYIEVKDNEPEDFISELEDAVYNNLDYDGYFVANCNALLDSDVVAVQHEGYTDFFYNDVDGLKEVDFEVQPQKYIYKSQETVAPDVAQNQVQTHAENPFAQMNLSDKLRHEDKVRTSSYDVRDFYLDAQTLGNAHHVTLYDRNFSDVAKEIHTDPAVTTTQAINDFCEKYDFEGADKLKNRSATMLDPQEFHRDLSQFQENTKTSMALESAYFENDSPQYAIYRMNDTEKHDHSQAESYPAMEQLGIAVDKKDYQCIAQGSLEDLVPNYQEGLQENPMDLRDTVQAMVMDFSNQGEDFEQKYGMPNTGDVFVFQHEGKEEAYFMDFEDSHKIDFVEQEPKVTLKNPELASSVTDKSTDIELDIPPQEKNLVKDITRTSDKLLIENTAIYVAYDTGNFYVTAESQIDDKKIALYDMNLQLTKEESYPEERSLTSCITDFAQKYQFDGADTLQNRKATMLNYDVLENKIQEAMAKDNLSAEKITSFENYKEDSFAVFRLKENDHTDFIEGKDLPFLDKLGEVPSQNNYECIYSSHLDGLVEAEYVAETGSKQELMELIEGNLFSDMEFDEDLKSVCHSFGTSDVLAVKLEGEIYYHFMTEPNFLQGKHFGLEEIPFEDATPTVELKQQREELTADVTMERTEPDINYPKVEHSKEALAEIQSFFEEPIPSTDLERFNQLVADTTLYSDENSREMIFEYLISEIADGKIEMSDMEYLAPEDVDKAINSHMGILVDREVQLENVVRRNKEEAVVEPNLGNVEHISQVVSSPLSQFQENMLMDLIESAGQADPNLSKDEMIEITANLINDEVLQPDDFGNMHLEDFLSIMQQPDMDKVAEFSSVEREMQGKSQLETSIQENNIESLLGMFQESSAMKNVAETALEVYALQELLENPIPIPEMEQINSYVTEIWLKSDDIARENIVDFIAFAINDGAIQGSDLNHIPRWDFVNAFLNDDTDKLGEVARANIKEESILKQEDVAQEVAYQVGDTSIYFKVDEKEVTFGVFDQNLDQLEVGTYENMSLTEGINQFASSHDLPDMDKLAKRDVESLDVDTFVYETSIRYNEKEEMAQEPQEIVEILEESQATKETQGESKGSEEKVNDIVLAQGEDDVFEATLTTQERVIIQSATDFAYDHLNDFDSEQKVVMRDILGKIDPQGDLLKYYPKDYVFPDKPELSKQTTILFTEEELEMIGEVCDATKLSWDDISNEYYDLMDSIVEKVENPLREVSEEILHNVGNLAEEPKENAPRMVAGSYEITDSIVMGGEEIALGESPSGMAGTWERSIVADEDKGIADNWYSGHYFGSKEEAVVDFNQRIEDKVEQRTFIHGDKSTLAEKTVDKEEKVDFTEEKAESKSEKAPRESVLGKLKEIKEQIGKQEQKEQPSKDKDKPSL